MLNKNITQIITTSLKTVSKLRSSRRVNITCCTSGNPSHAVMSVLQERTFKVMNSTMFSEYIIRIYPIELVIQDTTDTGRSTSFLFLYLTINSEVGRELHSDNREHLYSQLWTLCSNIASKSGNKVDMIL